MSSHARRISTACLMGLASLTGACADANLTGPNVPGQPAYSLAAAAATAWTASGDGTVTLVSDGTAGDAVMSYVYGGNSGDWYFTTTAAQTGTVTLPWSYSGDHGVEGNEYVYALINGVVVATRLDEASSTGPFSWNGTITFSVNAGDTYGFQLHGSAIPGGMSGTFTLNLPEGPVDPTTKEDCKDGEWVEYGFNNQGQCIRFVNTGDDSR
jgi:hypothetical protein